MSLDHHCVFLNNCVAAANLRHFLLFLFWLGGGASYVAVVCSILLWRRRPDLFNFFVSSRHLWYPSRFWQWPLITWIISLTAPTWMLITLYLLVLTLGTCVGVVTLLCQQLRAVQRQQTYVEALKTGQYQPIRVPLSDAVRKVMGPGNPLIWMVPSLAAHGTYMAPEGFGKLE
jgi:DHHC palmitoyltransferase